MRHHLMIGIMGAACAAASGIDYVETFVGGRTACVSFESDPGYSFSVERGRLVGYRDRDGDYGSTLAVSDFTIAGNFDITVDAVREQLGFRGVLGVIVLYDDGQFVNLYFRGDNEMAAVNSFNGHQWLWLDATPEGSLRMHKVGTTLTFEFDTGAGYEVIGTEVMPATARPGRVYLFLTGFLDEPRHFAGSFDNWRIEADTFNGAECLCPADYNRDGAINPFDILAFQSGFENGDPRADFALPWGKLDIFDFLTYRGLYGRGCP